MIVPFEQPLTSGAEARRLTWQRYAYWDSAQSTGVVGDLTEQALLHHVETAVFTPGLITQAYEGEITTTELTDAGYVLADGHHWNPGLAWYNTTQTGISTCRYAPKIT